MTDSIRNPSRLSQPGDINSHQKLVASDSDSSLDTRDAARARRQTTRPARPKPAATSVLASAVKKLCAFMRCASRPQQPATRQVYYQGQLWKVKALAPHSSGAASRQAARPVLHEAPYGADKFDSMYGSRGLLQRSSGVGSRHGALDNFLEQYLALPVSSETAAEAAINNNDDSLSSEDHRAIQEALYGADDAGQNSHVASAVERWRFVLRDNRGGGDCLFHALTGTAFQPSVGRDEILKQRQGVAEVRLRMPEDGGTRNSNGHEVALALNQSFGTAHGDARRPVSNALFAALQKIPGVFAGNTEIQQWLNVPGNKVRSVVVVDAQSGNEALVTITASAIESRKAMELGETAQTISDGVASALQHAIAAENDPGKAPEHIALYRTAVHWQRITGFRPPPEGARAPSPQPEASADSATA